MEMAKSKCKKESEDEQTTSKRKRNKGDRFASLPDDIVLDILKRVPDVFLRYKAKYVCRRWFSMITNKILQDHASFILQNFENFKTRLVDVREEEEEGLQVKEQDLDIPLKGTIKSWCNEFLLISDKTDSLYVYNVITKKGSYLPECDASCGGHYYSGICKVALLFDRSKGIYKVSHVFIGRRTIECQILTLRRDENHAITRAFSKWKKLEVPHTYEGQHILDDLVTVQGRYLNWRIHYMDDLVSVDMVKEEIRIVSLPGSDDNEEFIYSTFLMGGCLALMKRVSRYNAEIWLVKDFENVKWDKVQSICDSYRYFD